MQIVAELYGNSKKFLFWGPFWKEGCLAFGTPSVHKLYIGK